MPGTRFIGLLLGVERFGPVTLPSYRLPWEDSL